MKKILVIQPIHEAGIELIKNNPDYEFEVIENTDIEFLKTKIKDCDGVSIRTAKLAGEVIDSANKLKIISRHGVGYDNIDLKSTKKNGCMITVKKINKIGLLNHVSGYRGQVELKNSELLDDMKHIYLEANIGDVILLHKHSIHCSLPNRSNDFRISADLRYNVAGQPSGREPLPNFYVRSKNKKNIKIKNFKQWLSLWERAKEKCIPRKYAFKYPLPTFKTNVRDLSKLI